MSRKHYNNYNNYNKMSTDKVEKETTDVNVETVTNAEEQSETKVIFGVVSNCEKLNVRSKPNIKSDIICVIKKGDKIIIAESGSTNDFYEVHSVESEEVGFHGFCMKEFITVE